MRWAARPIRADGDPRDVTSWQIGGLVFGYVVYAVAWTWGGRPERFGAGVLFLTSLLSAQANAWEVGGFFPGFMALDGANLLIFGWLCLRSDRWWPLIIAAALGLIGLASVIRLLDPTFSHSAFVSAKIGLAYVVDLALLLGVGERWLAGERPAGSAAWAKAVRARAALRDQGVARRSEGDPGGATGRARE